MHDYVEKCVLFGGCTFNRPLMGEGRPVSTKVGNVCESRDFWIDPKTVQEAPRRCLAASWTVVGSIKK